MMLTSSQQYVYDQSYRTMLSQASAMEKRYGKNWKQIIHTISINTAKKQAPETRPQQKGTDGCPCCN
jgi:hypothetical protein